MLVKQISDPCGSMVVPDEDGNTKSSSMRESPKKHWFITLNRSKGWNGSNSSNLNKWLEEHCERYIYQIEQGNMSDIIHIQLTMTMKTKKRFTWLKHHFTKDAHTECVRNVDASYDYCSKSDTRIGETVIYPRPLSDIIVDPLFDIKLYDWQEWCKNILLAPVDDRVVYWLYDYVGNSGKSDFTLHMILNYNIVCYDSGKKDILYSHKDNDKVIFDLSRTQEGYVSYDAIECLKKGFAFSGKYESGMKLFPKCTILIFANWLPDTTKLSEDRWVIRDIRNFDIE